MEARSSDQKMPSVALLLSREGLRLSKARPRDPFLSPRVINWFALRVHVEGVEPRATAPCDSAEGVT